jgi:molybdopterin converting factor small subunit
VTEVSLRLFAQAREAAGRAVDTFDTFDTNDVPTLGDLLAAARARYGDGFGAVLDRARVWLNGDDPIAGDTTPLHEHDEVAVLPPVSGG